MRHLHCGDGPAEQGGEEWLAMAEGKQEECLELVFDLKGHHDQQQGHMYSQRQHPQPKTDTPLTQAGQRARQLLRHHLYIAGQDGGTFPQLNWLLSPAKEQVALLFGFTVSVETVEFDQMQARYVRDQKSQSEQDAWDEAQVRIHCALVSMRPTTKGLRTRRKQRLA